MTLTPLCRLEMKFLCPLAQFLFQLLLVFVFYLVTLCWVPFYFDPGKTGIYLRYGNTGYGVSSPGIQNYKYFCLKINIPKGNYWILRIGVMGTVDFHSQFSYRHLCTISCDQSSKSYMKDTYLVNFFPCIISSTMSIKYNGMIHQVENDFRSQYI